MQSKQVGSRHYLRIDRGEAIVETITNYLKKYTIHAGKISGIGATDSATLFFFSMKDKQYHEQKFAEEFEILSLTGNTSLRDGEPWPHLHIVLSNKNYECTGGHLGEATVSVTCEVIIDAADENIVRELDEETGLKLWSL